MSRSYASACGFSGGCMGIKNRPSFTRARITPVAERACIMVWDGLRPDRVSPDVTPNLWHLASRGVWFERSHAVYPTLTRANSPAISTGCRPGRAGVPGNSFCLPAGEAFVEYSTGDAAHLQRLSDADGRPILL